MNELVRTTIAAETDEKPAVVPRLSYETPELVELGQATSLMRGNVYTKYYQDCGENGTTDYRPSC